MNEEKILELNKKIRGYDGDNPFIISLQRNLKSKYTKTFEYNNRKYKRLSDRQYEVAKTILDE